MCLNLKSKVFQEIFAECEAVSFAAEMRARSAETEAEFAAEEKESLQSAVRVQVAQLKVHRGAGTDALERTSAGALQFSTA